MKGCDEMAIKKSAFIIRLIFILFIVVLCLNLNILTKLDRNDDTTRLAEDTLTELIPANPMNIQIDAIGINHAITEYTNEMVSNMVSEHGGIYPLSRYDVGWWAGGGRPGATLNNTIDNKERIDFTTYLYGHSTNDNNAKAVFDDIDMLKEDDCIIVDTATGQYKYLVDEVVYIKKTDLSDDCNLIQDIPGRLILISCWKPEPTSCSAKDNVVVIATLCDYSPN